MKQLRSVFIAVLFTVCACLLVSGVAFAAPEGASKKPSSPDLITKGTVLTFGRYQQDQVSNVTKATRGVDYVPVTDGSKKGDFSISPIAWRVIADSRTDSSLSDGQVLVIAQNVLDYGIPYAAGGKDLSWAPSDLRQWLNGVGRQRFLSTAGLDFLNDSHFSVPEYNAIVPQTVNVEGSESSGEVGASRAFILTVDELQKYGLASPSERVAGATPYSKWVKGTLGSSLPYLTLSAASGDDSLLAIGANGATQPVNVSNADFDYGIRPAMVLDLNKLSFKTTNGAYGAGTVASPFALTGSESPHSGFSTTTSKCDTCHSLHDAPGEGEFLLPTRASAACTYCHVDTTAAHSSLQVYGSDVANYMNPPAAGTSAHYTQTVGGVATGTTCADCHVVHGKTAASVSVNSYLASKLLQGPQTGDAGTAEFNANPITASDEPDVALSKWCVRCHPVASHGGHPISAPSGATAFQDATTCQSCHGAGYGTSEWPHYSADSEMFLLSANNASSQPEGALSASQDGVCLRCHRKDANSGVGIDY